MRFIDHYNQELRQLRGGASRFAKENPQVASHLGVHPDAITDPFVERLLEGLSYLSARIHTRLDLECSEFAQQALGHLAPLFLRPTPSMATLAFHPDHQSPESLRHRVIPKGQLIDVTLKGRQRAVTLRTGRAVHMLPLRLERAECARSLSSIPTAVAQHLASAQAVLRLNFTLEGHATVKELTVSNETIPLSLSMAGDLPLAFSLHRTLMVDCLVGLVVAHDGEQVKVHVMADADRRCAALDDEQALLSAEANAMPGLRLLREYFANPARFLSVDLDVLGALARLAPAARQFELIFGLRKAPTDLLGQLSARHFRLFATPVVNLYPKRLDPIPVDAGKPEQWVAVDRMRPKAHQLWSIEQVHCAHSDGRMDQAIRATVSAPYFGDQVAARWSLRMLNNESGDGHVGADDVGVIDHITLSYPNASEDIDSVTTIHIKGLVMDREWKPQDLLDGQYVMRESHALGRVECLWPGSSARPGPQGMRCWEAAQLIALDPLGSGSEAQVSVLPSIKNFAQLATHEGASVDEQRLGSLDELAMRRGFSRAGPASPMAWVRSRELEVKIATAAHPDQGAWLFGRILAEALNDYTPVNDGFKVNIHLDGELCSQHTNLSRQDGRLS